MPDYLTPLKSESLRAIEALYESLDIEARPVIPRITLKNEVGLSSVMSLRIAPRKPMIVVGSETGKAIR